MNGKFPIRAWKFCVRYRHRISGVLISAVGIAVVSWYGVISTSMSAPPSTAETVVLITAASALQIWAGVTFGRVGHVDAEKAKSAVRRLITIGRTSAELRAEFEYAVGSGLVADFRNAAVRGDEGLRSLTRTIEDSISDWTDIHSEALSEVIAQWKLQDEKLEEE